MNLLTRREAQETILTWKESARVAEKSVRFAEFELDFGRFQLFRGGYPVRLEGLPLQILMLLVERHRQLVTREQIADALWGKEVFVDVEQGINTAIRKVRIALEDDSDRPQFLQTLVGRGYRFIASLNRESTRRLRRVEHVFCGRIGTGSAGRCRTRS